MNRSECDDLWTYIGQDTWLVQIAEARYLIRTTVRNTYGGTQVKLMMIDHDGDICQFLGVTKAGVISNEVS